MFKSLLFLGAGAVVRATGTRVLDELGGLGRRMPLTALAFLLGSVAIVGLPPLNGFVSEWVVFQALFRSGAAPGVLRVAIVAAAGLGLIGGLALACFTKVDGVVFLGRPALRSGSPGDGAGARVGRTDAGARGGVPGARALSGARGPPPRPTSPWAWPERWRLRAGGRRSWSQRCRCVSLLALGLIGLGVLLWLARGRVLARSVVETAATWACAGAAAHAPDAVHGLLLRRPAARARSSRWPASPSIRTQAAFTPTRSIWCSTAWSSRPGGESGAPPREARLLQAGRLRWYLLYVILTLLALLIYLGGTRGAR